MRLVVLWDIDHTLIETRGVGRELYQLAFERATGVPFRHAASVSGSTELRIFAETAVLHGVDVTADKVEAYAKALRELHLERFVELQSRGRALPGAREVLAALAAKGYVQTVVTGNLRDVAVTKLQAFGLDEYLDLEPAAFAEDAEDRDELVRVALRRAGADRAVLVGDTPADVGAGKAARVAVIAVATGRSTADELRSAGADVVLADLSDVGEAVAAIARLAMA